MLSKALLASLYAAVAVAAPALPVREVPCTSVISPGGVNPAPSPSVILLNGPSGAGRIAGPQDPPVINLNPPAPSPTVINLNAPGGPPPNLNAGAPPSVINLNKRQLSSLTPTSSFSFGGIVPSSTSLSSSTSSFNFGGIAASSSSFTPLSTATPSPGALTLNSTTIFSSIGPDGVKTVLLLSATTVTVSGAACSTAPAFNPSQGAFIPPASSASSSAFGANVQAPPAATPSSPSIIDLNSPPATATSAPGFSFTSATTPAV